MCTQPPAKPPFPDTVGFYNNHAEQFYANTIDADVQHLYTPFLALLPAGAHILDAGCGSGRDSLYFKQHGYPIIAFDASESLIALSTRLLGQPVLQLRFQEITFVSAFQGIWACVSLLHVPRSEIDDVLNRLSVALVPDGVLFASFKYGDLEVERDGRLFNSYTEASFGELCQRHTDLRVVKIWRTMDTRPDHQGEEWLDVLLRKT